MFNKFVLVGLPGVGKSTILEICLETLGKKNSKYQTLSIDEIINKRMKPEDAVIQRFEKEKQIKIPIEILTAPNPNAAFIKYYGDEPLFRDLEEIFIKDILRNINNNTWLDLGGKASLREETMKLLISRRMITILLYAEHSTIIERLEKNNNWEKRGNYFNAESTKAGGWKQLALEHRRERLAKHINTATIIINTDKKLSEEIAKEVLYSIKNLELATSQRTNQFIKKCGIFFTQTNSVGKSESTQLQSNYNQISCQH